MQAVKLNLLLTPKPDGTFAVKVDVQPAEGVRVKPWNEAVNEYRDWGRVFGGKRGGAWSPFHASQVAHALVFWETALGATSLADITLEHVERALASLKGLAPKTVKLRYEALRGLVSWCLKRDYLDHDPLKAMARLNTEPQRKRRALTSMEVAALLEKCLPQHRLLYMVALDTGLRRGELAALTSQDVDVSRRGLVLPAAVEKERRGAFVALSADTWKSLCSEKSNRLDAPLLHVPKMTARALRGDLKRAGIPVNTPEGVVDFHALRATYLTLLEEAGATDTEVRAAGRHTTAVASHRYRKARPEKLLALKDQMWQKINGTTQTPCSSPSSSPAQDIRFSAPSAENGNKTTLIPGGVLGSEKIEQLARLVGVWFGLSEVKRRAILGVAGFVKPRI